MSEYHQYHNNSGPGFTSGVLLGTLIGAGIIFLMGTKQGKEITQELKEKGLSLVDDFDELLNELEEDTQQTTPVEVISLKEKHTIEHESSTHKKSDVQSLSNFSTVKVEQAHQSSSVPKL